MNTVTAIAGLGTLMLFLVALSVLLESVRKVVRPSGTAESSRSWETTFLLWLNFVLILVILLWRAK